MSTELLIEQSPLMKTYNRFPITLEKGKGSYVWDQEGTKYLDFTSGIATCNLGHLPDVVKEHVDVQLEKLWHCSNLYHIPEQEALAELLVKNSCGDQVFFCNSGAEANEAAIKLARRYASVAKGGEEVFEIVAFNQSFHGRTIATLSATGQSKLQDGFAPLLQGFRHLPYNDVEALNKLSSDKTCAVLVELVQGEGGVNPADVEWIQQLEDICKANDILLMVDEIQTGMGRTGTLFAYEQYGIDPDVISVAKGLGSGFPIGAVIAKAKVAEAFGPGTHGSTFGGNPLASSAGFATVNHLVSSDVINDAFILGQYLKDQLEKLKAECKEVKEVRGKGLLIGMEISGKAISIVEKAREKNVLILVAGPNVVRILPPLTTSKEEIDYFIGVMKEIFVES
ncbi:acetylornithine transaminase [Pseudalkalibacillus salsuginis]|uniref:acetylornithine transaminase n=1 Tax=Pseudalkalibacillus salsuginis TaxID=2910972 RepID=UPI001F20663B|nr:acetylornithine transaminase [Pseudalkalibacillus salsuginis]MCF6409456.1 acetylornithine transaminase [Pseudalkalibacillus salsuginis]